MEDKRNSMKDQRQTDRDLAEQFLEEVGEPAHKSEIIAYVISQKRSKALSIEQCLFYNARFTSFGQKYIWPEEMGFLIMKLVPLYAIINCFPKCICENYRQRKG